MTVAKQLAEIPEALVILATLETQIPPTLKFTQL